eukprot:m.159640 g.159640  ORF g.159640 m.159640 type:complete len:345 (-) comp10266_c0_seq5:646-1680(-)
MRRRRTELDTEGAEADEAAAESVTKGDAGEDDDDDSGSEFGDERSPHEQLDELTRLEEQLEKLDVAIEAGGPEGLKAAKARRSVARAHERLHSRIVAWRSKGRRCGNCSFAPLPSQCHPAARPCHLQLCERVGGGQSCQYLSPVVVGYSSSLSYRTVAGGERSFVVLLCTGISRIIRPDLTRFATMSRTLSTETPFLLFWHSLPLCACYFILTTSSSERPRQKKPRAWSLALRTASNTIQEWAVSQGWVLLRSAGHQSQSQKMLVLCARQSRGQAFLVVGSALHLGALPRYSATVALVVPRAFPSEVPRRLWQDGRHQSRSERTPCTVQVAGQCEKCGETLAVM